MLAARLLLLLFSVSICRFSCDATSSPEDVRHLKIDAKSLANEGDILWTPEQYEALFGKKNKSAMFRIKRQLIQERRWPDNTVYYYFDENLSNLWRVLVAKAIKEIEEKTCLTFVRDETATDRIQIKDNGACYSSSLGRAGGRQEIGIGGCTWLGNVVHEFLHTLGVIHTASRSDRDQFLLINLTGPGDHSNFFTYSDSYNLVPFEYGSLMMYTAQEASWPRDESWLGSMGTKIGGFYDIKGVHDHYRCSCPTSIECFNGGYMNTQSCDKCVCPPGFAGKQCDAAPEEFVKKLTATLEWQTHSLKFGYDGFSERIFKTVTLFIEAPADKRIQVEVTRMDGFGCNNPCFWSAFEVKHMGDPRRINQFVCCNADWIYNYTSKLNPTPVLLHSISGELKFEMRYRYINESISALPTTNNTYDDFRYPA